MADREKVIKGLECCTAVIGVYKCRKCPYEPECQDVDLPYGMSHLAADALTLLREQEPMEPAELRMSAHGFRQWAVCGNCHKKIYSKYQLDYGWQYCPVCGRRIKWNNKENENATN